MGVLREKQENQNFKVILHYIAGSRQAWAVEDPVSKKQNTQDLYAHGEISGKARGMAPGMD